MLRRSITFNTLFLRLQVILTVYLNDTQQMLTEVPVTPATRVIDVVEYCKEAGEGECHLAEVWNGHGESICRNISTYSLLLVC